MSSGFRKKEPKWMCLCVAKASHSHKTWAEVSSSAPHFLHKGLSLSPIMWRCLLKVLCPVSRPVTTLDCVLLKDSSLVLAAVRGPRYQLSSLSLIASYSLPHYQMLFVQPALNFLPYTLPRHSQGRLWSHKMVIRTPLASSSAISFPHIPVCPGTQKSPTE